MAQILKPDPLRESEMLKHWWQWVLLGIIAGSATIGILYILYNIISALRSKWNSRSIPDVVSTDTAQYLDSLSLKVPPSSPPARKPAKPSSFGVYLGSFSSPPSPAQARIFERWDLLILDPLMSGVHEVLPNVPGKQFIARYDLAKLLSSGQTKDGAIKSIVDVILRTALESSFTGIALAGWEDRLSPAYMSALARFVHDTGLLVYLETAPPDFLKDAKVLNDQNVAGVIIRNASILPNGEKRDYFDMIPLQPTLRAFVLESCLREFTVMAWEELNDDAYATNAVIKRGIQWCSFYSALTWIGSSSAVVTAELNHACKEPLGAFEWLKDESVMKVHENWKENTKIDSNYNSNAMGAWEGISGQLPEAINLLRSAEAPYTKTDPALLELPAPTAKIAPADESYEHDPLSFSPSGTEYNYLGCFPLGTDASPFAFAEVLQAQNRLKRLNLLHPVDQNRVSQLGSLLRKFHDGFLEGNAEHSPQLKSMVKELASLASNHLLRINLGLDPGFKKSADIRFWAVYQTDADGPEVFVSKNAQGLAGTVLHAFLSSRGFSRSQCFEVEYALAKWSGDLSKESGLPRRLTQDIDLLTPEECLLFIQHLGSQTGNDNVLDKIKEFCRTKLIDGPSGNQLKELHTVAYLNGTFSASALIKARIAWYDDLGCIHPTFDAAISFFTAVDAQLTEMFRERREQDLKYVADNLNAILVKGRIDAWADLLGLAVFCSARRGAFDEVYAEVTDRNPLFNDQSDQAAAFAESFALGSRCEAYFDVSPSVFGKLLYDRFRAQYQAKQPPTWVNGAPEFATTYGGAQIDIDPGTKVKPLPGYQRFTFLSVFAIPALIDIVLLTTVGRGLYLSGFMTPDEVRSATVALMISLLLSGAIGTWIACGGSYYLVSMAFSAMNVFVLSRLIAGLAFTIAGGLIGFAIYSALQGIHAGIIFFVYLVAFTSYLTIFAAIASFQFPGTSFLSGRRVILFCIPWLAASPLITAWSGHDAAIYICVMYTFIAMLLLGLRNVGAKWVTWYQHLRNTDDSEVRNWYLAAKAAGDEKALSQLTDPAALKLAREALLHDVLAEVNKGILRKATKDKLVFELARDWNATKFLLDWYCRYADVAKPIPYSSSWNIQAKVALQTLSDNQKGIRLHNAFIHWRQAGDEVGCGILYFVVALLDKWVDILTGGHSVGLAPDLNSQFRMATGFGLAYYLIGSVLIDTKAQALHEAASTAELDGIKTDQEIRMHQKRHVRRRRAMYWKVLGKFLAWHVWSLVSTATLIWFFQHELNFMVMFCAYVFGYTGLLWYQYTKIFSGPYAFKPLLVGVCIGIPLGVVLKNVFPKFSFSTVIALGVGAWTAAILSLWTADIGMPKKVRSPIDLGRSFHAFTRPWADPEYSQQEMEAFYEKLSNIPADACYALTPSHHPGAEVKKILLDAQADSQSADDLVGRALQAWERGQVDLVLVPLASLGAELRAISCAQDGKISLIVGVNNGSFQTNEVSNNCNIVAEYLVHAVAEALFHIPHEHAALAETVVSGGVPQNIVTMLAEEQDSQLVMSWAQRQTLKQQCLGIDVDTCWDKLPKNIRKILYQRCLGQTCMATEIEYHQLASFFCQDGPDEFKLHLSRCNLAVEIAAHVQEQAKYTLGTRAGLNALPPSEDVYDSREQSFFRKPFSYIYHSVGICIKFFVIAICADPEFQREFDYVMRPRPWIIRVPVTFLLNGIWTYARFSQHVGLNFFLFHGRQDVKKLWDEAKAMTVTLKHNRIVIRGLDGTFTAFRHKEGTSGGFKLHHYKGVHKSEPKDDLMLHAISTYNRSLQLMSKQEYRGGKVVNEFQYEYRASKKKFFKNQNRLPINRTCTKGERHQESINYDGRGLVDSGSYLKDGNLIRYKLHYRKNARFGDQLLRAEFVLPHMSCTVAWCAPPRRHAEKSQRWIPHAKITEATFVQGADVYESRWLYDHKFHPTIFTTCNGIKVQTPPMIEFDWLGVLKKPKYTNFGADDPIVHCNSLSSNPLMSLIGLNQKKFPVSTSLARSKMWKAWKTGSKLDGVMVRWLDDRLLRNDSVLRPYWRSRNRGDLAGAKKYLDARVDAIQASADLDDEISSWTPLAVKITDLYNFGPGGEAIVHTRSKELAHDTEKTLHVLAADNGTWPNEGGGVSACRRDLVNSLTSVKWHMLCESATDFGIPKHQTEQNVQSLKVIPLWGLDFLTPTHGLFSNRLDSEVDMMKGKASDKDIARNFIPTLTALVKGARATHLSKADIKQATRALLSLNDYFQDSKHWSHVWTSDVAKESWRKLWLAQDLPNAKPSSQWLDTELPTLGHLDTALDLWFRYLFVFSIPVPEKIPAVFQASHHSVSAAYGVVCKLKRNSQLQIWDHAIAWRETNMCLSATLCKLPPFVRNSLLGLMRLFSVLILHHADVILPCADFFNPGWEVEIGTCQGAIEHRNSFKRKIAPVVNGITDAEKFKPIDKIKSDKPTVTMLSHLWFCKDLKTAILAADIIVNEWGFKDYQLDVYGSIEKAPTYSVECQELLAAKSLRGQVKLCGTADPLKVLEKTWLFLNSSLSEGLPLALGEAALTGAPVVCTDVGASLRVLSDPDDFSRYSAVVAPNDARALARAQIKMLGMLGEWGKYAEDEGRSPDLSFSPTPQEVEMITRRMYEKSEHRRKLGMKTRDIVQKSFGGERYLREHEQMLWVGKCRKMMETRFISQVESSDPVSIAEAIDAMAAEQLDEGEPVIPLSRVHSWGAASVASSMYQSYGRSSMFPPSAMSGNPGNSSESWESHRRGRSRGRQPNFSRATSQVSLVTDSSTVDGNDSDGSGISMIKLPRSHSNRISSPLPVFAPGGSRTHSRQASRSHSHTRGDSGSGSSIFRRGRSRSRAGDTASIAPSFHFPNGQLPALSAQNPDPRDAYRTSDVSIFDLESFNPAFAAGRNGDLPRGRSPLRRPTSNAASIKLTANASRTASPAGSRNRSRNRLSKAGSRRPSSVARPTSSFAPATSSPLGTPNLLPQAGPMPSPRLPSLNSIPAGDSQSMHGKSRSRGVADYFSLAPSHRRGDSHGSSGNGSASGTPLLGVRPGHRRAQS